MLAAGNAILQLDLGCSGDLVGGQTPKAGVA